MANKSSHKSEDLRAALAHMPTEPTVPVTDSMAAPASTAAVLADKAKFQLYFHPGDRQRIRELAAWFAGQGVRINDSLIIRSALRAVEMDSKLLEACRDSIKLDQRFKKHR